MCGNYINDNIREIELGLPIVEKMVETSLRWFGHAGKMPVGCGIRRVDQMQGSQITRDRKTEKNY